MPAVSSSDEHGTSENVTDNDADTRWASNASDNQWIYVDLGKLQDVNRVVLDWQEAFGKEIKIQVSKDAKQWADVAVVENEKPGVQSIYFDDTRTRYVRMLGVKRGSGWGYSLWSFQVFGSNSDLAGLSAVHFIRLQLKNKTGDLISNNFYWRGNNKKDFTALNSLPAAKLKYDFKSTENNGRTSIEANIANPINSNAVAFAVHVELVNNKTGEQIPPALMDANYFTLLKGESRKIHMSFETKLLKNGAKPTLRITPYNTNNH